MTRLSLLLPFVLACGGSPSTQHAATAPSPTEEVAAPDPEPEAAPDEAGQEALLCYEDCMMEDRGSDDECHDTCNLARPSDDPCFEDCMADANDEEVCAAECS